MGKIWKSVKTFFATHFGSATTAQQSIAAAKSTLAVVATLATSIVGFTAGGEAATQAASVVSEIQADLGTATGILQAWDTAHPETAKASLSAVLGNVNSNLSAFLTAGHVKDPALQSKISTIVATVSADLGEVVAAL